MVTRHVELDEDEQAILVSAMRRQVGYHLRSQRRASREGDVVHERSHGGRAQRAERLLGKIIHMGRGRG